MADSVSLNEGEISLQVGLNRISNRAVLAWMALLWSVPTILTLVNTDPARITNVTLLVGLMSCGFMLMRPLNVLICLPFFALLSPVGGFIELFGVRAVLADWIMLALIVHVLFSQFASPSFLKFRVNRNSASYYLLPLMLLFLVSFILGFLAGNITNFKILYYLISFVVIYYYFNRYACTENEWQSILLAWTLAASLGSLILIQAFFAGEPLVNFAIDTEKGIDRSSIHWLFRASYYYSGFHFIAGIMSVSLLLRLVFGREAIIWKLLLGALFAIFLLVLLIMLSKTAIFSALMSFFIVYIVVGIRIKKLNLKFLFGLAALGIFGIAWFVSVYGVELYQSTAQLSASAVSSASFLTRTEVWINSIQVLFERPWYLITGLGPGVIEMGNQQVAELFKVSAVTMATEGALDSTWLTFFVELGIFAWFIFVGIFIKCFSIIKRFLRVMRKSCITNPVFLAVFGGLVYLVFAFIPQSLGYSKISWLPFQLILIAFAYPKMIRFRHSNGDQSLAC